ncbi:MAG: hypothetical protein WC876_01410 [Candidatus Thermoplasmatota archaeon]|jgi:hypothetical protein
MLAANLIAALVVAGVAGAGTMANEAMHGDLADGMGFGHSHMTDYDGAHCASHTGPHAPQHMEHMHNGTMVPHDSCAGGAGMHNSGTARGGMMHG